MNELLGEKNTLKQAVQATLGVSSSSDEDDEEVEDEQDQVEGDSVPMVMDESMKRLITAQSQDMADLKKLLTKVS